jgi:DNA-binding XRE family transcriptional regulator
VEFRHLDYAPDTPVVALGPAGLDALLERGDLDAWAPLARAVAHDPWGSTADAVLRLCGAHPMYGTSVLWRTWIERRRRRPGPAVRTLAGARARAGLTQAEVAARMGISQSDVSKIERRSDLRLSTLRAYARAIGARLSVGVRGPSEAQPTPLAWGEDDCRPRPAPSGRRSGGVTGRRSASSRG